MIFTVIHRPSAENELANFWIEAPDQNAVTAAANRIGTLLKYDPATRGESRSGNTRVLFVSPLGVDFEVHEQDRVVYVLSVWRIKPANENGEPTENVQ